MSQRDRIILRSADSSLKRSVVLLCNSTRVLPYKEITNCRPRVALFTKTRNIPFFLFLILSWLRVQIKTFKFVAIIENILLKFLLKKYLKRSLTSKIIEHMINVSDNNQQLSLNI